MSRPTPEDGPEYAFDRAMRKAIREDRKRTPPPPCAHCGQRMKPSQVVSHGDAWVHRECKEAMRMEEASARARQLFGIDLESL